MADRIPAARRLSTGAAGPTTAPRPMPHWAVMTESDPAARRPRFLQLADVAEILNISAAQAYALVRNGSLPAIKVGGRGQWRVEADQLEAYIQRAYDETKQFVASHPYGRGEDEE